MGTWKALTTLRAGTEARISLDRAGLRANRGGPDFVFPQGIANTEDHVFDTSIGNC